ncbi:MAG: hypothetical protein HOJ70_02340, partial [Microbacteriaceae bacterium]|nr:hypothetical protein [Microbacteriaceae bacterium]
MPESQNPVTQDPTSPGADPSRVAGSDTTGVDLFPERDVVAVMLEGAIK